MFQSRITIFFSIKQQGHRSGQLSSYIRSFGQHQIYLFTSGMKISPSGNQY